jgi:hypothetical protein
MRIRGRARTPHLSPQDAGGGGTEEEHAAIEVFH